MNRYLKVSRSEFNSAGEKFKLFCEKLSEVLEKYISIINSITTESIKGGSVHDALDLYKTYIVGIKESADTMATNLAEQITAFITDLDKRADYLSDKKGMLDFTQEEYELLCESLDEPLCYITDEVDDWFQGIGIRFSSDPDKKMRETRQALLDYKDANITGINAIFESVHECDREYGRSVTFVDTNKPGEYEYQAGKYGTVEYQAAKFGTVWKAFYEMRKFIEKMAECIKPGGNFTVSEIKSTCGPYYDEMMEWRQQVINVYISGKHPTVSQIGSFSEQWWAETFFVGLMSPATEFIKDLSIRDVVFMEFFNSFNIAEDVFLNPTVEKKKTINGEQYLISYDDFVEKYRERMMKKQLLDTMADTAETYQFSEAEEKKLLDISSEYLGYAQKGFEIIYGVQNSDNKRLGSTGKKFLDGRTKEAKMFKGYIDALGGAQTILKYGSEAIDYATRLFTDYSKGLVILESFEKNYNGDESIEGCIGDIKDLYNKEFSAWAMEAFDGIKNMGWDFFVKDLGKVSPVISVVNKVGAGIELVGKVTGLGAEYENKFNALTLYSLSSASNEAYVKAFNAFKTADSESEEYETLANDVVNCFELSKNNMLDMYEALADASTGTEKEYYRYCCNEVESLNIGTKDRPNILLFDEYLEKYLFKYIE